MHSASQGMHNGTQECTDAKDARMHRMDGCTGCTAEAQNALREAQDTQREAQSTVRDVQEAQSNAHGGFEFGAGE